MNGQRTHSNRTHVEVEYVGCPTMELDEAELSLLWSGCWVVRLSKDLFPFTEAGALGKSALNCSSGNPYSSASVYKRATTSETRLRSSHYFILPYCAEKDHLIRIERSLQRWFTFLWLLGRTRSNVQVSEGCSWIPTSKLRLELEPNLELFCR